MLTRQLIELYSKRTRSLLLSLGQRASYISWPAYWRIEGGNPGIFRFAEGFFLFLLIPLTFSYPAVRCRSASCAAQVLSAPHGAGSSASASKSCANSTAAAGATAAAARDSAASTSSTAASASLLPILLNNVVKRHIQLVSHFDATGLLHCKRMFKKINRGAIAPS